MKTHYKIDCLTTSVSDFLNWDYSRNDRENECWSERDERERVERNERGV